MEYIPYVVVFGIVVLLVLFCCIYFPVKKKKQEKKVMESSLLLKKLKELNSVFPSYSIEYQHGFEDHIEYKTRSSVLRFDPDKEFIKHLDVVEKAYARQRKNQVSYDLYKEFFEETRMNVSTSDEFIEQSGLKKKTYLKIEVRIMDSLFLLTKDDEDVYYSVYAVYYSPKEHVETKSHVTFYYAKDHFYKDYQNIRPPVVNYDPHIKEENEPVTKVNETIEEERTMKEETNPKTENKSAESSSPLPKDERSPDDTFLQSSPEEPSAKEETINTPREEAPRQIRQDGILYAIFEGYAFPIDCDSTIENLVIPGTIHYHLFSFDVISVPENAFMKKENIVSLTLGEGIETISKNAFRSCSHLKEIRFNSDLKRIEEKAFNGCTDLEEVSLPDFLEFLGQDSFSLCPYLKTLTLPGSIKTVEKSILWLDENAKVIIKGNKPTSWDEQWNISSNPVEYQLSDGE